MLKFLLINVSLEETITVCTGSIYKQNNTVESLSKSDFRYERVADQISFSIDHYIGKYMV